MISCVATEHCRSTCLPVIKMVRPRHSRTHAAISQLQHQVYGLVLVSWFPVGGAHERTLKRTLLTYITQCQCDSIQVAELP